MGIARPERIARWEGFELDAATAELRRANGKTVRLADKPFQILLALLERPGHLVSREDLRKRLWPNDTVVEFEHAISAGMNRLRQVLRDSAERPKFIETLARRGYRWKVPVTWGEETPSPTLSVPLDGGLIGKLVSHYRVLEILGGGGMGVVYKAEDLKLGRRVALKFLPQELAGDGAAMQRFEREARAASALNHPNICTIYEVEEHEALPFMVMELLEGQTLREIISAAERDEQGQGVGRGQLPLETLLNVAIQTADGLEAAHKNGIVHRDIKPANIFVTHYGQTKILDFGLAKLQSDAADIKHQALEEQSAKGGWDPLLTLTRTGTTIGTAAYMSPEQVRGEKLDARTDLFSFGLVLYEMATRQRAFAGDSAPVLHHAILNQIPVPAKQLNPRIPGRLESIIGKAIAKVREARYQTAAEIRADLENLKTTTKPRRWRSRVIAAVAIATFFIVALTVRYARHQQQSPTSTLELKLRQLTTNPPENPISSGTMSPDGKYLVYGDRKGMHVKEIETGAIRTVPVPSEFHGKAMDWRIMQAWLADGAHFLLNAHPLGENSDEWTSEGTSIWVGSVLAQPPRKLRDEAIAFAVSPDGSQIAFGVNRRRDAEREAWVMGTNGEGAHQVLHAKADEAFLSLSWLPTGDRIFYIEEDSAGNAVGITQDIRGGPSTVIFPKAEMAELTETVLLHDGRMIYAVFEPGAVIDNCNYWVRRIDWRTGERLDQPKRLTNWTSFCPSNGSLTADEKRLAFLGWASRKNIYVADFTTVGAGFRNPRPFTLDESDNLLIGWTADSKSVIFRSPRDGTDAIYRQALNEDAPALIARNVFDSPVTTDGTWLFGTRPVNRVVSSGQLQFMRVPIIGGSPQPMFPVSGRVRALCSRSPVALCAIAERSEDRRHMTLTEFDPIKGRGRKLVSLNLDPQTSGSCDISPDGSQIAVLTGGDQPIQIFSLLDQSSHLVNERLRDKRLLSWAANGKGLFVTHEAKSGSELMFVDLKGRTTALWKNNAGLHPFGLQSPDGKHVAIQNSLYNGNMWIMQNF